MTSSRRPMLAGALAAATALGAGELASGLFPGAASLVLAIGNRVIDLTPGGVERAAIGSVGHKDKPLLITAIVVVVLLLGALFGRLAARRYAVGAAGFVGFAVVGVAVALGDQPVSVAGTIAVGLVAAAAGLGALALLLRAGRAVDGESEGTAADHRRRRPPAADRRHFLRVAVSMAAVAGVSAVAGRLLAGRQRVSAIRAAVKVPLPKRSAPAAPAGAQLDVPGITPLYIPNRSFYRIDTALSVPQVDTANWSLRVRGAVARPLQFSYDELLAMPQIEADATLSCVSNEVGGDLVGNARWQGVALRDLLDRAGVQPAGTQIMGRSVDGFTAGFPTQIGLQQPDAMVALVMNGEPLPARHGFPARLVVPGLYGYVSATKWLSSIDLVDFDANDGYWIRRGWSKLGPIKTQSRIDVPGRSIPAGRTPVAGVAWAPTRGISKVEVSIDEGAWQQARLAEALSVETWRQWVYEWDATPGQHVISVRASDGTGEVQTAEESNVAPSGATGHHTIRVDVS